MSDASEGDGQSAALVAIGAMAAVAIGIALWIGIAQPHKTAAVTTASSSPATVAQQTAGNNNASSASPESTVEAVAAEQVASVTIVNGNVHFYFAPGKADLADGAKAALADAVAAAKRGRFLVISGFHDPTGDPAANEELAKQRALNVRAALVAMGVPQTQLYLLRPTETTGDGSYAQARRVEVVIVEKADFSADALLEVVQQPEESGSAN
ncbi:MAG: hypothetical protein MESAZ_01892 [Saezia sanguinis]